MSPSDMPQESTPPATVSFRKAFAFWLKLGFISFGGPAGQIAIMHQELVENRRRLRGGRMDRQIRVELKPGIGPAARMRT